MTPTAILASVGTLIALMRAVAARANIQAD